jgi:hypothetical protein
MLVHFLQKDQIGVRTDEEFGNFIESATPSNVPGHNVNCPRLVRDAVS